MINDWNEQYSPKKLLQSPRKSKLKPLAEDDDELSPSESPLKHSGRSPAKKSKQEVKRRKAFEKNKDSLAREFLAEVDQAVGDGQVTAMAASTGGVKIVWSKKLSSTAGRANWRREVVRSKTADGAVTSTVDRHHVSIELAEKVIDDEGSNPPPTSLENIADSSPDRLTNVIAHEYCHLANFMISNIKDAPHGASFKAWAAKTTHIFKTRNIHVTTKHTYEIAYKYLWACTAPGCGLEYKRHSKSIDPKKHSCGNCKAPLVQTQPVPRQGAGEGKRSGYQVFVKREQGRVRKENPEARFGEVMAILGREFRESKKQIPVSEDVVEKLGSKVEVQEVRVDDLDDVAKKLNFLDLDE